MRRSLRLAGLFLRFGEGIDPDVNGQVHAVARAILEAAPDGLTDVVPSYASLYLEFDRERLSADALQTWAERLGAEARAGAGRRVVVPVRYDGPDLEEVASRAGLSVDEVVRLHAGRDYRVYALGFTPGFPFLGELDPAIRTPRLPAPRARVEAHSVAIADAQTGIYPLPSPGGWRVLGSALEAVYDPHRDPAFLVGPGDVVAFEPAAGETPAAIEPLDLIPREPRDPVLRVHEPGLLDLIVDAGRFRAGRFGLARSGPVDAHSADLANRILTNPSGVPLIEINVAGPVLELLDDAVLAFAGWGVEPELDGEPVPPFTSFAARRGSVLRFTAARDGVRGYLAVAGGLESTTFLGSASVDARGLVGRALRAGDVLGRAGRRTPRAGFGFRPHARFGGVVRLRLEPGPHPDPEAIRVLTREPFVVRHADRMGLHLDGPEVPGGTGLSEANPLGAVQVTAGGLPLVLLNDRGTIGGYAKPAIVHPDDLPRVGQLRAGERVRFVLREHGLAER